MSQLACTKVNYKIINRTDVAFQKGSKFCQDCAVRLTVCLLDRQRFDTVPKAGVTAVLRPRP